MDIKPVDMERRQLESAAKVMCRACHALGVIETQNAEKDHSSMVDKEGIT
jgi:hypothetical protein